MRRLVLLALPLFLVSCKGPKGDKGDDGSPNQIQSFTGTVGGGIPVAGGGFIENGANVPPNNAILVYVSQNGLDTWHLLPSADNAGSAYAVVTFQPMSVTIYNTNPAWFYRIVVVSTPFGSSAERLES